MSLLSVLSKMFMKILLDKFNKLLQIKNLIQEDHNGFKKGLGLLYNK